MDPLAQLKDIHVPTPIHNYPIAPGWWILLVIAIIAIVMIIRAILRHKRKTRAKKIAIKKLMQPMQSNDDIIIVLKWAVLQYFPRQSIAQFYGQQLTEFLLSNLPEKHHKKFTELSSQGFSQRYQVNENGVDDKLVQAALLWLKYALPAKNISDNSGEQA